MPEESLNIHNWMALGIIKWYVFSRLSWWQPLGESWKSKKAYRELPCCRCARRSPLILSKLFTFDFQVDTKYCGPSATHTHAHSCHKRAHVPNSMHTCVHSCMLMCTHACTLRSQTRLLKKKNWSIVDLQCWNNFCCTAQWLSYAYICILFLIFCFIMIGPRTLDIIPCAVQ